VVLSVPMTEEGAGKNRCRVTAEGARGAALARGMTRMRHRALRTEETGKLPADGHRASCRDRSKHVKCRSGVARVVGDPDAGHFPAWGELNGGTGRVMCRVATGIR
jgi:hypothetical protein